MGKQVRCGSVTLDIERMNVSDGLKILARLQAAIGGSIFQIAKGVGKGEDEQVAALASAIDSFTARVTPEEVFSIVNDVLTSGTIFINGTRVSHIDEMGGFDEDPYTIALFAFREAVQLNFSGFIKKLMGGLSG